MFMEFSRQEYWSGLPFPSPGKLPNPGIEPSSPTLQADSLPSATRKVTQRDIENAQDIERGNEILFSISILSTALVYLLLVNKQFV